MPSAIRLLKRFSMSTLRRNRSVDDDIHKDGLKERDAVPPLPFLPPPHPIRAATTPAPSYDSRDEVLAISSTKPIRDPDEDSSTRERDGSAATMALAMTLAIPPAPMVQPVNTMSEILTESWAVVQTEVKPSSVEKALNTIENKVSAIQGQQTAFSPLLTVANEVIKTTGVVEIIEQGINSFFDGMPVLMSALDKLGELHPFIGVAVMAFKTVYTLELKRRENEKKIIALYVEMKDMMSVLLQLQGVHDPLAIAPDGSTLVDRLGALAKQTAEDIKKCSNACDTYSKKKLLAKVFQGPLWDTKLLGFVTTFTKRRTEFEFALSVHTSLGVDELNVKLLAVSDTTSAMNAKMDAMLSIFHLFTSPEQKQLKQIVDSQGGPKALLSQNSKLLELLSFKDSSKATENHRSHGPQSDFKTDLYEDPDSAIEKNVAEFTRKFDIQKQQIVAELSMVVVREGDRVIKAMNEGPHEKLVDPDIYTLWREMGWRGNVKARHFVLALRDFYQEKFAHGHTTAVALGPTNGNKNSDGWALKYLDVMRVQPILEAFDDDASGFISVGEMNRFTTTRPKDWSLPHWIAFWATGWKSTIIHYKNLIEQLFAKMDGLLPLVLGANQGSVLSYFSSVWTSVRTLTAALEGQFAEKDEDKFKDYVEAEEERLKTNLEAVNYIIDGLDTLSLITGPGRIEKSLFPVIYLLIKHHYEILRLARTKIIHLDDFYKASESMLYIGDAVQFRYDDLKGNFRQQKVDPSKQFEIFASGIFKYVHDEPALWSSDRVKAMEYAVLPYIDAEEDQNIRPEDYLSRDYEEELKLDGWVYETEPTPIKTEPASTDQDSHWKDIAGKWHGYRYENNGEYTKIPFSMITLEVCAGEGGGNALKVAAYHAGGRFVATGTYSQENDGTLKVKLEINFAIARFSTIQFTGTCYPDREVMSGDWGNIQVVFKRMSPQYLRFYPPPVTLTSKARALWGFAIAAIVDSVRQRSYSWDYFRERRDTRKEFMALRLRKLHYGVPLTAEELEWYREVSRSLTTADACFYNSRLLVVRANTCMHDAVQCDNCGGKIGGARIMCLECESKDTENWDSIDLCENAACVAARVTTEQREDLTSPHEPTHRMMKLRSAMHLRQTGRVDKAAREALKKAERIVKEMLAADRHAPPPASATSLLSPTDLPFVKKRSSMLRMSKRASVASFRSDVSHRKIMCGVCHEPVSLPCWYCIYCSDDLFICESCDAKGAHKLGRQSEKHDETHPLIRCQEPQKEQVVKSVEERMTTLETRFADMEEKMIGRMDNIERLLQLLLPANTTDAVDTSPPKLRVSLAP